MHGGFNFVHILFSSHLSHIASSDLVENLDAALKLLIFHFLFSSLLSQIGRSLIFLDSQDLLVKNVEVVKGYAEAVMSNVEAVMGRS